MVRPRSLRRAALLGLVALAALAAGPDASARRLEELDPKVRADLVEKTRLYFDPTVDAYKGRKAFRTAMDALAASGTVLLQDLDLLQDLLYQARVFDADFAEKSWQKNNDIEIFEKSGPYLSLKSQTKRFTYVLPTGYPNKGALSKPQRQAPYPLLLVLHEEQDYTGDAKQHPGQAVLERRYPKGEYAPLYDQWLMLAPTTPRAKFLEDDGRVRSTFTTDVFLDFWKRYHVDFDRVVVDGTDAAIAMVAQQPVFYSGLVVRGGKVDATVVRNYASVPVYVVGDEKIEQDLKAAGHPDVTRGAASGLPAWLAARKRATTTKFSWNAKRADQLLANFVSIQQTDPGAAERTLDVEVDRAANKVTIAAKGILELAVFLNDRVVDLDKPVELVVNGHVEQKQIFPRDLDAMLDREPLKIRRSMYLGWLFPVAIWKLPVKPPAATESEKPAAGSGTAPAKPEPASEVAPPEEVDPAVEKRAENLWKKAEEAEAGGDQEKAKTLYREIVGMGSSSFKGKADERLKALGGSGQ